uniref:Annexin n=1 Tax=Oncorhynchus tshawytscha TaxID=74940 RepID=A0AAZ3NYE4_ONCTS
MANVWGDLDLLLDSPSSLTVTSTARGTIKEKAGFKAAEDVVALRKAIEGIGTTEKTLVEVLTGRSNAQRQLICKAYQEAANRTLVDDLKGDTHGDFEDLLVALVTPPALFDCHEVIRAIKGPGTTEETLTEIFASRSNKQIKALSDAYLAETGRSMTHDLKSEVSGDYATTLLILAEGKRDESTNVDPAKAKADAKALYEAGEKKWGTDESKFIDILCHRSVPQLRQMKCVKSVPAYLAERLFKSTKGVGTTESVLTRIMVGRSEMDMLDIRAEFKKLFGCSLYSTIKSETAGSYGQALLKLCGEDD